VYVVAVSYAYVYGYGYVPVAEHGVQVEDDGLLVGGDLAPLEVRPEVVHPPQPAALPAPPQPCRAMHHRRQQQLAPAAANTTFAIWSRMHAYTQNVVHSTYIPVSLATEFQQPSPCCCTYSVSSLSSSAVQGPFLQPCCSNRLLIASMPLPLPSLSLIDLPSLLWLVAS
jgi:hypothetical protein